MFILKKFVMKYKCINSNRILNLFFLFISIFFFIACKSNDNPEKVVFVLTGSISKVTHTNLQVLQSKTSGNIFFTSLGICYSTNPNPIVGKDSVVYSTNGNSYFNCQITNLSQGTKYFLRAFGTNEFGKIIYGELKDFTTVQPSTKGTFTDVEGNIYKTVTIGNKTWMAENLKSKKFRNGDPIVNIKDNQEWSKLTTAAYCSYDNTIENEIKFGLLYNFYAVKDLRNIAPEGWHVASSKDWYDLIQYLTVNCNYELGGVNNYYYPIPYNTYVKALASESIWISNNNSHRGSIVNDVLKNNKSGFSALPGGTRSHLYFSGIFNFAAWWSSDGSSYSDKGYSPSFAGDDNEFKYYEISMITGRSVRCVKD